MLQIINFKDLSKIKDKNLLKLTNKVYELAEEEQVSELALHYFINEVSKRHYDIDDVNLNKATDEYLCFDNDVFIYINPEGNPKETIEEVSLENFSIKKSFSYKKTNNFRLHAESTRFSPKHKI